ncbi:hypothetical protein RhiirB3_437453 [Rhizophagus irregularis]|nr:hypothetical protein RhiirB3_437453 [Rhizophagus irregularis]
MGEVLNFPIITVQGIEVPINMVVTESETYSVIIGNNLLRKVKANIDYETSIMIISWKGKEARVLVEYQLVSDAKQVEEIEEEGSEKEEEEEIENEDEDEEYKEVTLKDRLFYTALFDPSPILTNEGVYIIEQKYYQQNHFTELNKRFKQSISPEIIIELSSNKRQSTPTKEQQEFILTSQLYDSDTIGNIEYEELTQEIEYNYADIENLSKITLMELSIGKLSDNQSISLMEFLLQKGYLEGLIECSTKPWASPVVLVQKKNGKQQLRID